MRTHLWLALVLVPLFAAAQNDVPPVDATSDMWCPVDEVRFHSQTLATTAGTEPPKPDTLPVRIFVFYSSGDPGHWGIDSAEYVRAIYHMVYEQGDKIAYISGLSDTSAGHAFEIAAIKAIAPEDFGPLTNGCNVFTYFSLRDDGILDQERDEFECSNAQTALFITPNNVNSPNGCASGDGVQIRSFWIWAYYTQGLIPLENARNAQDSAQAIFSLDNRAGTLFHELGHNAGGRHWAGEGTDETVGIYLGRSKYGTLPSTMYGAYGSRAFHYSNIYGPEPLTDGIVDHVSYMIRNREAKHAAKPAFRAWATTTLDTLRIGSQDFTRIDILTNREDWEDAGELKIRVTRPDGSVVDKGPLFVAATWSALQPGPNYFYIDVSRDCPYGPRQVDTVVLWLVQDVTSTEDKKDPGVRVYPNPFEDQVQISSTISGMAVLRDLAGRRISTVRLLRDQVTALDLGLLPRGLYLLTVSDDRGSVFFTEKLVK